MFQMFDPTRRTLRCVKDAFRKARRLPREERFPAFVRCLPNAALRATRALEDPGFPEQTRGQFHILMLVACGAYSLVHGDETADLAFPAPTSEQLAEWIPLVSVSLMLEHLARRGFCDGLVLPRDPFDAEARITARPMEMTQ